MENPVKAAWSGEKLTGPDGELVGELRTAKDPARRRVFVREDNGDQRLVGVWMERHAVRRLCAEARLLGYEPGRRP